VAPGGAWQIEGMAMTQFTEDGRRLLDDIAARYGVSFDAVQHLLMAVIAGNTTQAQFNHPELGGMGQWSQGGMIMVGDMFNNALKARVDGLCNELAGLARSANLFRPAPPMQQQSQSSSQSQYQGNGGVSLFVPGAFPSGNWWPEELGYASSTGAQNDLRYAFFPQTRRLAINIGGRVTVYDTRDHQIGGFSQQQSGDQSLSFTSQYGLINLSSLDVVPLSETAVPTPMQETAAAAPQQVEPMVDIPQYVEPTVQYNQPANDFAAQAIAGQSSIAPAAKVSDDDIFAKIERLAELHGRGILNDDEYQAKKADLLSRL
jgi:hypothetical protein